MGMRDTGRGVGYTKHYDETLNAGIYATVPNLGFLYETSTTQSEEWAVGDKVVLGDGREFRYAKSASALNTSEASHFTGTGVIAYTAASTEAAIDDTSCIVPAATHAAAIAVDELRGGFLTIFGSVADGADMMFRGIVGNDYSAINAAVTIYVDAPFDVAIDASSAYEVWANPWSALEHTAGSPSNGKAGVPVAYVSAAATYHWTQTAGPLFCNPQSTVIANEGLGVNWRADGSLDAVATALTATVPDASTTQYAGFRMLGDYDNNGPIIWFRTC